MSWKTVTLETICKIIGGSTPQRTNPEFWENGKINWFTIEDIRRFGRQIDQTIQFVTEKALRETSLKIVPANTVLLCCTASVGEFAISKIPLATNQQFNGLILKTDKVLPKFLFHYCSTLKEKLISISGNVTINFVAISKLKKITIPLPPLTIQQTIVDKLDTIFAEIDKATATAETNVKNAEALFQSYLNKIYNIKENLTKLKDCTKIKPPKSEIKPLKGNTSVSFIPMESLGINNKFIISKQSKELEIVKGSYTYFKDNDILLAKITPCFENGKLGIANNLENGIGFGSSEYIVFRVNQNLDKEWLYYFLNRESFRTLGSQHMSGSVGHKRITKEFIEETLIPLIPIAHQKKLVSNIDNLFSQSQTLKKVSQNKISELFLLKRSILKQAFNGELVKAA